MKKQAKEPYFSQDLQSRINALSTGDMNELLLALEGSAAWIAILKYLQGRQIYAQDGLKSMDPVNQLVEMCRIQGTLMGLSDLPAAVILLKDQADRQTEAANADDEDENDSLDADINAG